MSMILLKNKNSEFFKALNIATEGFAVPIIPASFFSFINLMT